LLQRSLPVKLKTSDNYFTCHGHIFHATFSDVPKDKTWHYCCINLIQFIIKVILFDFRFDPDHHYASDGWKFNKVIRLIEKNEFL